MKSCSKIVFCPHCDKEISRTLFFQHKRLYYSRKKCAWSKERIFETEAEQSFSLNDSSINSSCSLEEDEELGKLREV